MNRIHLQLLLLSAISLLIPAEVFGQAGLRESLERLDKNNNGEIDPDEVTPLARPYLERITSSSRMSIGRNSVEIEDLQEAARRYYSQQNGAYGSSIRPSVAGGIQEFGRREDEAIVPQFGLSKVKYPYTQDDLDFADRTMRRTDENDDGYIDREEARGERWTHRDPFADDYDKDGRLSRLELAQRYARRRMLDQSSDELRQKAWRGGSEVRSFERQSERRDDSQWWRQGGNSYWLTASVLGRFDANKNGRLELHEAESLGLPVSQLDVDRNGELSREELHAHLSELQEDTGGLSEGIPGWFYELDANRDRQVSMSEFATEWSDAKLREFTAFDLNSDGLLTASEVLRSKSLVGGSYRNQTAEVLAPGRTVISEIDISDDFMIGDLNVQLSITHTNVSYLDAYLTGPDGQRIELFTEVGGRDDHFDGTIFDDQSQYPIVKARPPFKGTFMPEALVKRQPSLSHFNGKSVQGVWQLVIRGTRSDRFGMLHSWSLRIKPIDEMLGEEAPVEGDGPQPGVASTGWPMQRQPEPAAQPAARESTKANWSGNSQRPSIDYQAINQRFQAAVKEGKMTEQQVRDAWVKIKGAAKGGGEKDSRKSGSDERSREDERRALIERMRSSRTRSDR